MDIERAFNRAVFLSFSKRKMALTFPVLVLCGILMVFSRAVAYESSAWVAMSFLFLPILFSSGILLALGILLVRLHHHEAKMLKLPFKELLHASADLILGTLYFSLLPIFIYLGLWVLMGVFLLLQAIPGIGYFFSTILAFGPFLLVFFSILLCFFNFILLFFVAPAAALQGLKTTSLAKKVFEALNKKLFSSLSLFLIAIFPLALISFLFFLSGLLTNANFLQATHSLSLGLQWFFIMVPCSILLTPFVVFFFNFSAESYQLLNGISSPSSISSE